ncbi:MAG: M48 family metalloprotease [Simkaniaceae bacterium]|nr:M48 family metalloprotease [Simkaniaceae bacterium]
MISSGSVCDFVRNVATSKGLPVPGVMVSTKEACASVVPERNSIIFLSKDLYSEMEKELTNVHKFILAHELGHVFKRDSHLNVSLPIKELFQKYTHVGSQVGVLATLALVGGGIFFKRMSGSYLALVGGAVLLTHSITGEFIKLTKARYRSEYEADEFAAKLSPEIAQGGVQFFEDRKLMFTQAVSKASIFTKVALKLNRACSRLFFPDFSSFSHPTHDSRIAKIAKYARSFFN